MRRTEEVWPLGAYGFVCESVPVSRFSKLHCAREGFQSSRRALEQTG